MVLAVEEEQLSYDQVGGGRVDFVTQEDDSVFKQARVDVVGSLTVEGLFDDSGN